MHVRFLLAAWKRVEDPITPSPRTAILKCAVVILKLVWNGVYGYVPM
jgi:hypothetical protein